MHVEGLKLLYRAVSGHRAFLPIIATEPLHDSRIRDGAAAPIVRPPLEGERITDRRRSSASLHLCRVSAPERVDFPVEACGTSISPLYALIRSVTIAKARGRVATRGTSDTTAEVRAPRRPFWAVCRWWFNAKEAASSSAERRRVGPRHL